METVKQSVHVAGRGDCDFIAPNMAITCSEDGSVRLVSLDPLDDSGYECYSDERHLVKIAVNPVDKNCFALAKEESGLDGFVQLFTLVSPDGETRLRAEAGDRMVQTSLGVCDIAWSHDGQYLAVAFDSDGLKVLRRDDPVASVKRLTYHQGAVKSVSFDPKGEYLASVGADGSLCITRVSDWSVAKMKKAFCERDDNAMASLMHPCRVCWSENGALLVVPGDNQLRVLKRDDWDENVEFEAAQFDSAITLTAMTDSYIAASCDGDEPKVVIWDARTRKIAFSFTNFEKVFLRGLRIIHDKSCVRLVGIDSDGEMTLYQLPINSASMDQEMTSQNVAIVNDSQQEDSQLQDSQPLVNATAIDDEDDPNQSVLKLKESLGFSEDAQLLPEPNNHDNNVGSIYDAVTARDGNRTHVEDAIGEVREDIMTLRRLVDHLKPPKAREPFQPSATSFGSSFKTSSAFDQDDDVDDDTKNESNNSGRDFDEDVDRRFLVWNHVGTVVCRKDREKQSIEIDFTDTVAHRPVRISDHNFFDKASLSDTGAFFSSTALGAGQMGEDSVAAEPREALLHFRSFAPKPFDYSWTLPVGKKDQIIALACGSTFCVAATKKGFLRVFRPSGLQEPVMTIPGPVLCMVAQGSFLLVLFHTSLRKIDHELGFQLLDFGREGDADAGRVIASGPLPSDQGVTWCGFGDESLGFMPLVYRRDAVLLGLSPRGQWSWVVMSDGTGLERGVKLWPISASREGGLLAVELRHKRTQPSVVPRSSPSVFKINVPILREKSKQFSIKFEQEATLIRDMLVLEQRRWAGVDEEDELTRAEAMVDVEILRGFAVAVKLKEYARALGLATRLKMQKTLELALEKATEFDADQTFQEKLVELVDERAQQQQQNDHEEVEEVPSTYVSHVSNSLRNRFSEMENYTNEDEDSKSITYKRGSSSSVRVQLEGTPKKKMRDSSDDEAQPPSPFIESKKKSIPPNPFLKSASPVAREKKTQTRSTPIRLPELSRQSSFTVEARSDHKRRL